MTTLLGPLLEEGVTTTLVGALGLDLAALTAAICVSCQTGVEVVPGWEPKGPGYVTVDSYGSDWATWRGLFAEVCDVARVDDPSVYVRCRSDPLGQQKPVERDPAAKPFWSAGDEADVEAAAEAAKAIGRPRAAPLSVVFGYGASAASGFGSDMRALYEKLRGGTALVVDGAAGFTTPVSAPWTWIGSYGPIVRLEDLRNTVVGLPAFLERVGDRYVSTGTAGAVEAEPEPSAAAEGAHRGGDVNALLAELGIDAVRQLCTDGQSVASKQLKALARARGLGPGALYHAARRIAGAEALSGELTRRIAGRGPGTLFGYAAVFGQWREVNSVLEGNFLQRLMPGCFTATIAEVFEGRKVTFLHGKDPRFGHQSLGPITLLEERPDGLYYEVKLLDTDHCWELAPWLATGRYGGSLTFDVLRDTFVRDPGRSEHNPEGLPEQTCTEIRVQEFGPVDPPAYAGTSAGIRVAAD